MISISRSFFAGPGVPDATAALSPSNFTVHAASPDGKLTWCVMPSAHAQGAPIHATANARCVSLFINRFELLIDDLASVAIDGDVQPITAFALDDEVGDA